MATQALLLRAGTAHATEVASLSAATRECVDVGGVSIDHVDVDSALDRIEEFLESGRPHQIVTVNLDFLAIARRNPAFLETLNGADLAVADGMPVVWLSRLRGMGLPERVTGVELVHECCRLAAREGRSVFLLGAAPGIADRAARNLQKRYRGLKIAGTYSPPVGELSLRDNARLVHTIRAAQPDFLFVALGAPRQDLWIRDNLDQLGIPVAMGVGCVFDVLAGVAVRAPRWMQATGLEWAYRLGREPARLWRRYLLNDAPLMASLLLDAVRRTEHSRPGPVVAAT
jgi:N-acetylglucosaminyldiphosphoundecaprenol N-acetyl-beta-D-mannosaminyltransferase